MDNKYKLIVDSFGKDRFKVNEPIKNYTLLSAGGLAKLFFIAFTGRELIKIITLCRQLKLPYFLFGSGSKIMISDAGFDGLVIKNRTKDIHIVSVKGKVSKSGIGIEEALVEVESGVSMTSLCAFLNSEGLESEIFSNLPGTIGGNLFISNLLQTKAKSIKVLDQKCDIWTIEPNELSLRKHVVLSGIFRIKAK